MIVYITVNVLIIALGLWASRFLYKKISTHTKNSLGYPNPKRPNSTYDYSNNYLYLVIIFFLLAFITIFRSPDNGMSVDYGAYQYFSNIFYTRGIESSLQNELNIQMEPGLILIMSVLSYVLPGTILAFIFLTTIGVLGVYIYRFRRDSEMVWLSFLMLVAFGSYYVLFNAISQAFAIALVYLFAGYLYKDKTRLKDFLVYALVVTIVAVLIHKSLIVMLPAYFVLRHRINLKLRRDLYLVTGLAVALIFGMFFTQQLVQLGTSTLFTEYSTLTRDYLTEGNLKGVFRPLLICIFLLAMRRYIDYKDQKDVVGVNAAIIFLIINTLAINIAILQRFSYIFIPYVLILIPNVLSRIENTKQRNLAISIVITVFLLYSFASMYIVSDWSYEFIWDYNYATELDSGR